MRSCIAAMSAIGSGATILLVFLGVSLLLATAQVVVATARQNPTEWELNLLGVRIAVKVGEKPTDAPHRSHSVSGSDLSEGPEQAGDQVQDP